MEGDTALPSLAEQGVPRSSAPKTPPPAPEALPPLGDARRQSFASPVVGRWTRLRRRCWRNCSRSTALALSVVPHEAVSRDRINSFDTAGAAMVCISYLEISGSPAHLRYLLRRLRQRLPPHAPILVGLWPAEEEVLTTGRPRPSSGPTTTRPLSGRP